MHIFCSNPSIVLDLGHEGHFMLSLFKFLQEKIVSKVRKRSYKRSENDLTEARYCALF